MNEVLQQVNKAIDAEINQYNALQYQKNYLKSSLNLTNIKPAYGFLRQKQQESVTLAKNILAAFETINISPMLSGHSLLGAVRHKGFIPWESNMQFAVIAEDFWKIADFIKEEVEGENTHHFIWIPSAQTKKKITSNPLAYEKNILEKNILEKKQNEYNANPQDEELAERILKMELEIEADALTKFQYDPFDFFTTLNDYTQKYSVQSTNQSTTKKDNSESKLPIFIIRTPYALEFYTGTSIENLVRVQFVPYYFLNANKIDDNLIHTLQTQAQMINGLIQKSITYGMVFHFYDELLKANSLYASFTAEKTDKKANILEQYICAGINNHEYIRENINFQPIHDKAKENENEHSNNNHNLQIPLFKHTDFFPLKSIEFEGHTFHTFNNTDTYLKRVFGTYNEFPKYLGISPYYVALNLWLRDNKKRVLPISEATLV